MVAVLVVITVRERKPTIGFMYCRVNESCPKRWYKGIEASTMDILDAIRERNAHEATHSEKDRQWGICLP